MAPAVDHGPRSDLGALRQARAKHTFSHVTSAEDEEEEKLPDSSTGSAGEGLSDEDSVPGCGRGGALSEAFLWADMVDDDTPLVAPAGPCAIQVRKTPAQQCVLLAAGRDAAAPCQRPPLAAGREAVRALPPRAGAGTRTPLSAKSRPFVSGLRPLATPPGSWGEAALVGAGPEREGSKGVAEAETRPEILRRTTVLLRGLPRSCDREGLMNLLDNHGYSGRFNFVYLPVDFETSESTGCAFVNLTTPAAAEAFKGFFDGFCGHPFSTSEVCSTEWSRLQGLSAHIKHYRNSPVMHRLVPDECKPVLLANGLRRPFPKPTVELKEARKHRVKGIEA